MDPANDAGEISTDGDVMTTASTEGASGDHAQPTSKGWGEGYSPSPSGAIERGLRNVASTLTPSWRSLAFLLSILCALTAVLAFAGNAGAVTRTGGTGTDPWIASDLADYAPGSVVNVMGGSWQPGESVHINVNDNQGQTWVRNADVTADANGDITDSFNLPNWFVASYGVTATGASGSVATTSFTDGNATSVTGTVTDSVTLAAISGATVTCTSGCNNTPTASTTTNGSGTYIFDNTTTKLTFAGNGPTTLVLTVSKSGYTNGTITLSNVNNGDMLTGKNVALAPSIQNQATLSITGPNDATYGVPDQTITTSGGSGTGATTFSAGTSSACSIVSGELHVISGTGSCAITATKAGDSNFNPTTSAPFAVTIHKATLAVNADDQTKTYGDADPTATWSYSGFVNGDTAGSVTVSGAAACSYAAHSANAGSYPNVITCAPGTLSSTNYSFVTGTKGDLTIEKATLAVNADDQTKTYGEADPTATWSYSGFVNGDTAGSVTVSGAAACSYAAHSANAGSYPNVITCAPGTLSSTNYSFVTGTKGDLTIEKATLAVNADDQTKTYGEADPTATWSYSGFVNGDTAGSVTVSGAAACSYAAHSANAGSYPNVITCAPGTLSSTNYSFVTGTKGDLTIDEGDPGRQRRRPDEDLRRCRPDGDLELQRLRQRRHRRQRHGQRRGRLQLRRPLGERRQLPERDHLRAGHAELDQLQLRDRHQGRPDDREGDPGRQRRRPDEDLRRCRPDGDLELQRLRQRRHRRQRHGQRRGRLQLRRPLGQRARILPER